MGHTTRHGTAHGAGPTRHRASTGLLHRWALVVCLALAATACSSGGDRATDDEAAGEGATADATPGVETPTGDASSDTPTSTPSEASADVPAPTPSEASTEDLATATAFWAALEAGDREAVLSLVDPAVIDSPLVLPIGRAETIEGQLDWYEAVGLVWTADGCEVDDDGLAACSAAASNPWTEVLGVDPVGTTFRVMVGDEGVTRVVDLDGSFYAQWSPRVFSPFASWVRLNHPRDAGIMWGPDDVDEEILELFEVNTGRFVEAQREG